MKNIKGFTLIEILIVVAIIGILASTVLVGLSGSRGAARDARRISDLRQVQGALEVYYNANNSYPPNGQGTTAQAFYTNLSAALGSIAKSLPVDPLASNPGYGYESDGQQYIISASLEGSMPAGYTTPAVPGSFSVISCAAPVYCVTL